jgi:drug/metabolite transporter (DMT)-like permease
VAAMPIAEASALFFVSPIFMTILSKIILKNKVGIHRIGAIIIGFVGILLIIKPEFNNFNWVMILPIITAFCYSLSMILTILTKESDSVFEQTSHVYIGSILVGMTVYLIFGRYGNHYNNNPSLSYLLRDWDFKDIILISKILMISIFGTFGIFCLINAYRISIASIIAPFEYTIIIYALIIGYLLFDEILDYTSLTGITLIVLSGLYILIREKPRKTQIVTNTSLRK